MKSSGSDTSAVPVSAGGDRMPVIPDWSGVASVAARKALADILVAGRWNWRLGGIDPRSARVLATVLRLYVRDGRPPLLPELAVEVRMSEAVTRDLLDRLARHDLVLLGPDRTSICGAYSFTEKITGHAVVFENAGRRLNTMCAIDALGAGAMCRDISIRSVCKFCSNDIVAHIGDRGMMLRDMRPSDAAVWVGLRQSCGCVADTLCTELLLFCTGDHLIGWRSEDRGVDGCVLTAEEGLQIGKALFIDRAMMDAD